MDKAKEDVITVGTTEIEALIKRIVDDPYLTATERDLAMRLFRLVMAIATAIESKRATINRIRRLFTGKQRETESKRTSGETAGSGQASSMTSDEASERSGGSGTSPGEEPHQETEQQRRPGHGRLRADEYEVSRTVVCNHQTLGPGEPCPRPGCSGRLYDTREPQILIRLTGNPMISAARYEQQVLRCAKCGDRFAARLPEGVPAEKYDATADATIALMKYGLGMPNHRMRRLQDLTGVPLAESTQFERCEAVADMALPVYLELERLAACSDVVHHDDTGVKILSYIKDNRELGERDRKGMHTTGIGAAGAHAIALYASGRRHAGENLARLLGKRPPGLGPPIVMADAEAKNWTGEFEQVVSKCLQHGRRQFTEIETEFPAECRRVLDDLQAVYNNERQTRAMPAQGRLLYHQQYSGPILGELRTWCERQFDERLVEPNSALGRAIQYLLRHWSGLTRFLEIEGAPLDNNFVERVLKRAVLHRKNSLFYKTPHGAGVGDILMSLIETCALNKVNPFDYLATLVRQSSRVRQAPGEWLPWNYKDKQLESKAA